MSQFDILDQLVDAGNGYVLTSQAAAKGISRTVLASYVKKRHMERVGHGLYRSQEAWPDALYEISVLNQRAVFSLETALSLHGLMEREPKNISVTVLKGYNATHLRKKGIHVCQERPELA